MKRRGWFSFLTSALLTTSHFQWDTFTAAPADLLNEMILCVLCLFVLSQFLVLLWMGNAQLFCRKLSTAVSGGSDAQGGGHTNVIDVSRSSSSGQDSPTKPDRRRRVSIYFNNKKGDILQKLFQMTTLSHWPTLNNTWPRGESSEYKLLLR
jgi:hypothetical protein